jgi:hypothetical protein
MRLGEDKAPRKLGSRTPQQRVDALSGATAERRERPLVVLYDLIAAVGRDIERLQQSQRTGKQVLELECHRALAAFAGALPLREMKARHIKLHLSLMIAEGRANLPHGYRHNIWKAEDGHYWYVEDASMFKTR